MNINSYILGCFWPLVVAWLLLLLLLEVAAVVVEDETASNNDVKLLLVRWVDILKPLFSLLLLWLFDPDRELSQVADLSSRAAAGLEPLTFLDRFDFSSLMGVTGTDEDMALTWKNEKF